MIPATLISLYAYWCKLNCESRDFFIQDGRHTTVKYPRVYDLAINDKHTGCSASPLDGSRYLEREI